MLFWNLNGLDSFKIGSSKAVLMELLINNSLEMHTQLSKVTTFIFSLCQYKIHFHYRKWMNSRKEIEMFPFRNVCNMYISSLHVSLCLQVSKILSKFYNS